MNCQYCSTRLFDTDRECPRCGAPFTKATEQKEPYSFGKDIAKMESDSNSVMGDVGSPLIYKYGHRPNIGNIIEETLVSDKDGYVTLSKRANGEISVHFVDEHAALFYTTADYDNVKLRITKPNSMVDVVYRY
jgi:hypothetical protein